MRSHEPPPAGSEPAARLAGVTGLVAALAGVALTSAWAATSSGVRDTPPWTTVLALTCLLLVAAGLNVTFRRDEDDETDLDLFEAAVGPVILLLPAAVAVALVAATMAVAEALLRVAPRKAAFNTAQWAAAAGVGSLVLALLDGTDRSPVGGLAVLAVALSAVAATNHLAVVLVLAASRGTGLRRSAAALLPDDAGEWFLYVAATIGAGLVLAAAAAWTPVAILLFVPPLVVLYRASRSHAANRADLSRIAGLQRATQVLTTTMDPDRSLPLFVDEVRRVFHARAVELTATGAEGSRCYRSPTGDAFAATLGDPPGAWPGPASPPGDRAARIRPIGSPSTSDWSACLAAPLRAGDLTGMIAIYDAGGLEGTDEADLAVLEALAGEASSALERGQLLERLRHSRARFRALVHNASDLTLVVDGRGVVLDSVPTRQARRFADDLRPGMHLSELVHRDDIADARVAFRELRHQPGATTTMSGRIRADDGSWRHVETTVTNLLDDPAVGGMVATCRDVTERVRASDMLTRQSEILEAVAGDRPLRDILRRIGALLDEQAPGAAWTVLGTDPGGATVTVAGGPLPAPSSDSLALLGPDGAGHLAAPGLLAVRSPGDELVPTSTIVLALGERDEASPHELRLLGLAGRLVEVAHERVRARQLLLHQATRDALTGLPNRLVFLDRAAVALTRSGRTGRGVGVIVVDLDRFKQVNESLGHDAGDRLLTTLAARLVAAMRSNDTVARFGGDEFTILCDDVADEQELLALAERIREVVAQPLLVDGHELSVTASVGLVYTADPSTGANLLIDSADTAMYRAKARGGNHSAVYDPELRSQALQDLVTRNALRSSIADGDLRLHYQPIVSLATGTIVGVEALVRWQHPELGLVPPDQFVPLAEETGLIVPLGEYVLREACEQVRRWEAADEHPITASINLSARQFADPDLLVTVADILRDTGVEPGRILFEITETVLMDNVEATAATLQELTELGVALSIDDFGTGYSSLSYLKRFPVGGLKIDRTFVAGLGEDRDDSTIVAAVVSLAHSLGMVAVAEGVETSEQLQHLHALGCDVAQGYYFSRPVPAEELRLADRLG